MTVRDSVRAFAFALVERETPAAAAAKTAAAGKVPPLPTERPNLIGVQAVIAGGGRIKKGDAREAVKEVQRFLNQQGVTDDKGKPLKEDGRAGRLTEQAIRNYQETHPQLKVDGVLGPRTLAAMVDDQLRSEGRALGASGVATAYPGGIPAIASR